jgi:hypothetical protein
MIGEGEIFSAREYTEGVKLSGNRDLIRTDLWRDHCLAPKGQGRKAVSLRQKDRVI